MPLVTTADRIIMGYDTFGDASNPPVVLIQGLGAQMLGWHPDLCRMLADASLFVIRFDNRDAGLSQKFPHTGYGIEEMASDAAGVVRALGYSSAHIVGQSMGGMIAQQLVISHPDVVDSLALIYTAANNQFFVGLDLVETRMDAPEPRTREDAVELYLRNEQPCASPGFPTDTGWLRDLGGSMYDRDPAMYDRRDGSTGTDRQLAAIAGAPDRSEALELVEVPTAILCGDSDRLIDPAASRDLHRLIPGSSLAIFAGMGHELPRPLWSSIVGSITSNIARTQAATGITT